MLQCTDEVASVHLLQKVCLNYEVVFSDFENIDARFDFPLAFPIFTASELCMSVFSKADVSGSKGEEPVCGQSVHWHTSKIS